MVKLSERPRERRLAAIVGAADHEHPLRSLEVQVVGRPRCVSRTSLFANAMSNVSTAAISFDCVETWG